MERNNSLKISWLAEVLKDGSHHIDRPDQSVSFFLSDSRKYTPPSESIFVALKGENRDGHRYIHELIDRGYTNFLVERWVGSTEGLNVLVVDDSWKALQQLARARRDEFDGNVMAITGSLGKTTVKEWSYELLNGSVHLGRSPGSFNSQLGVPLSVLAAKPENDLNVFEAGISIKGEMEKLEAILKPNFGLLCTIGSPHDAGFADRKEKIQEKLKLFTGVEKLIYQSDDTEVRAEVDALLGRERSMRWAFDHEDADYKVEWNEDRKDLRIQGSQTSYSFLLPELMNNQAEIVNLVYALMIGILEGVKPGVLQARVLRLHPLELRRKQVDGRNSCRIISDVYTADIDSLRSSIDLLYRSSSFDKRMIVLSSLKETGKETNIWVRDVASILSERPLHRIALVGYEFQTQKELFPKETLFFSDTADLLDYFRKNPPRDELILLKGARVFRFEQIEQLLKLKDHPASLEVDLGIIRANLRTYRAVCNEDVGVMAMVKAFSYGTGLIEVAEVLQEEGIDYLAVAYPDEGKEIRNRGIDTPILVLHPEVESFGRLIQNQLEPEIFSLRMLNEFIKSCEEEAISDYPIHLKLDTGMHRLGFGKDDLEELGDVLNKTSTVKVKSIFTHLAASEDLGERSFSENQLSRFVLMKKSLEFVAEDARIHVLNSSGISMYPDHQYDLVRLGIGLYGIDPSKKMQEQLDLCVRFSASISQIRSIEKGESLGYGRSWTTKRRSRIATLPLGYADGIPRSLSNGVGLVYIDGQACPIVGKVCMDLCMIDITDIVAEEGDEVVIFETADQLIDFAERSRTIPYEVLTSISKRIHRTYISS